MLSFSALIVKEVPHSEQFEGFQHETHYAIEVRRN